MDPGNLDGQLKDHWAGHLDRTIPMPWWPPQLAQRWPSLLLTCHASLTAVFPHSPGLERAVRGSVRGYQVVTGEQTAGWQMGVQLREDPDRPLPHTPPRRGQS